MSGRSITGAICSASCRPPSGASCFIRFHQPCTRKLRSNSDNIFMFDDLFQLACHQRFDLLMESARAFPAAAQVLGERRKLSEHESAATVFLRLPPDSSIVLQGRWPASATPLSSPSATFPPPALCGMWCRRAISASCSAQGGYQPQNRRLIDTISLWTFSAPEY